MGRQYNDLIGDILKASDAKDKTDGKGKGKGKPLPEHYFKKDILQNLQEKARDAGFLPPWLKLQKELSSLIQTADTETDLEQVNAKIKKYNTMCPAPMQKALITLQNLEKAKQIW